MTASLRGSEAARGDARMAGVFYLLPSYRPPTIGLWFAAVAPSVQAVRVDPIRSLRTEL